MPTLALGLLLLLGLQVWAAPSPGIEDAAFTYQGQDLLAEESAPSLVKEIPLHTRHRRHHFYHHNFDHWDQHNHNQYFPNSGCHHGGFGFGSPSGSWSHHGPPHPFGFGPTGPQPTPPYKSKLAPFNSGESSEYQPEPQHMIEVSTTSKTPPPTPPSATPSTTTPALTTTESDTLNIDLRIGS